MSSNDETELSFEDRMMRQRHPGGTETWSAEGPSGASLGPFPSRDLCLLALKIDADRCSDPARRSNPIHELTKVHDENGWSVWKASLPEGSAEFVIIGPDTTIAGYYPTEGEALDAALGKAGSNSPTKAP